MRVEDFYVQGTRRAWLVLYEKGGKFLKIPAHHKVAEALEAYLQAAGIQEEPKSPLYLERLGDEAESSLSGAYVARRWGPW
jgi:site-specific recombinase XerC